PNPKGISNNYYLDFNVNTKGLILNNSIQSITPTQLGGFIGSKSNHTEFKNPTTIKILKKAIDERKKK
ncbi:hypothetical protein, partial [Helicobacter sp. 11S03491-1]|uniref:hypothetical protein n=1 Tax=Helicobacter sp. 11S03491-1 TaxID=1476196 RepID=UPI001C5F7084